MKTKHIILTAGLFPAALLQANIASLALPGASEFDAWENLSNTNAQVAAADASPSTTDDFPGFPGSGPWPTAIVPDGAGSAGNAGFNKVSGNGYPGSEAIYTLRTRETNLVHGEESHGFHE